MSEDCRDEEDSAAPLLRRVFLKLGLSGITGAGFLSRVGGTSGPASGNPAGEASTGGAGRASVQSPAQAGFLPPRAPVLSLRGLDAADEFALSSVASDHDVARRPLSVRELVTPQNSQSTNDAATYRGLPNFVGGRVEEVAEWIDAKKGDRITWGNWLQDRDHMTHATVVGTELSSHEDGTVVRRQPEQRRALIGTVVRTATDSFRGMGSGHSHSEAAVPKDGFNDLKDVVGKLSQPDAWVRDDPPASAYDEDRSRPIDTGHLIRLGAGTVLKTLNRAVLPPEGLALPNMGSWDGQTLAGAINTATHGTGLELGSLADLVRSVEILVVPKSPTANEPLVRMLRIEPADGITDPVAFAKDAHSHDMTLIQDDDLFHSVVVGYGSMGIVYAYTIECQEAFWLRERNYTPGWREVDPVSVARGNRHAKVNIDLAAGSQNPQCWVRTWNLASAGADDPPERNDDLEPATEFFENFPRLVKEAAEGGGLALESTPPGVIAQLPVDRGDELGIDPFENGDKSASYIALRRRRARHPDEPSKPPEQPPDVISTEVVVPLAETEAAAQAVIDHVHRHDRWFPIPLSIRFAVGSDHYLSPTYGLDDGAAILEFLIPVLAGLRHPGDAVARGARAYLRDSSDDKHLTDIASAKREMEAVEDMLVDRFDGRPHLGKHNTVDVGSSRSYMRPQNMYPEYDTWLAAHRYVNRFGTFDGKFTDNKVR